MALERLVDEIRQRAAQELQAEAARLAAGEKSISEETDRRIAEVQADANRRAETEAAREVAQKVAGAKLQARKLVYAASERKSGEQLSALREQLAEFTHSSEYPQILKRMYAQTVNQLGKQVRISGRGEDAAVLKGLAGKGFDDTEQPILGGFIAETTDGTRRLNLSFDELLRLREDKVRGLFSE
jgi:vacuolar-type H+-ATPase subunit E/Vma4